MDYKAIKKFLESIDKLPALDFELRYIMSMLCNVSMTKINECSRCFLRIRIFFQKLWGNHFFISLYNMIYSPVINLISESGFFNVILFSEVNGVRSLLWVQNKQLIDFILTESEIVVFNSTLNINSRYLISQITSILNQMIAVPESKLGFKEINGLSLMQSRPFHFLAEQTLNLYFFQSEVKEKFLSSNNRAIMLKLLPIQKLNSF